MKKILVIIFLTIGISGIANAQLSGGMTFNFRNMSPGSGWGFYGDVALPTESGWKLSLRGSLYFYGNENSQYRILEDDPNSTTNPKNKIIVLKDGQISSFDRSLSFRIYYVPEDYYFEPYFGFGLTYSFNDITYPNEPPEYDLVDKAIGKDFMMGLQYMLGDNFVPFFEWQLTTFSLVDFMPVDSYSLIIVGVGIKF